MKKINLILLAFITCIYACEEEIDKSVITNVPLSVDNSNGGDLIMTDESAEVITVTINLSPGQYIPANFTVVVDEVNSTAVNGEDFIFEPQTFHVEPFVGNATFDVEIINDNEPEGTESIIFLIEPTGEPFGVAPATIEVQIANGTSQNFEMRNSWDGNYSFEYADIVGTTLDADTVITADTLVNTQTMDTTLVYDTTITVTEVDSSTILVPFNLNNSTSAFTICGLYNVGFNTNFVDFDVYGVNDTGAIMWANWSGCPAEVSNFTLDAGQGGYTTLDDQTGADVFLPYGTYDIAMELYIQLSYFFGTPVETTPFDITSTFIKQGIFVESVVNDTTWTLADRGFAPTGDGKFSFLYSIELQENFVRVSHFGGGEIASGRVKKYEAVVRESRKRDFENFDMNAFIDYLRK